eukprot:gene39894-49306_t
MLSAVRAYQADHYGVTRDDPLLTISAACEPSVNVTATIGCPGGATSCLISMRPNCELPVNAAIGDLAMSLFFLASIYLARFGEKYIEDELDEAVQTATDYSLEVNDPDLNADDPDEWHRFFTGWDTVLDVAFIQQIINVQIAACFTTTILEMLDIDGLLAKFIIGPLSSDTQGELNASWS